MTPYEQELLEKYLAHQNVIGDEGDYPDFESWYQAVRYARRSWRKPYFPVHHRPLAATKEDKDPEAAQAESQHHPRGTGPAPTSLRTS